MSDPELTHLDDSGRARMVDVGAKQVTQREASARALVRMAASTAAALAEGSLPKGDALAIARVAGIMAAKRTPDLIPLCHMVRLSSVEVDVQVDLDAGVAEVRTVVRAAGQTGVEMEALVAASAAALTLYDMVKAVERGVVIERVELLEKKGGVRGDWRRQA
ncbi:MAG: cyclic pyranopterin monophosphate synthase MoaC [Nitriliruptorales bacterium]|nr:cyclic pyranopterin monophosphate synthase MoaC [Nitriliruptorales bacterium]